MINRKLRKLLDQYQDELDSITDTDLYTCTQLKNILISASNRNGSTFSSATDDYIKELEEEDRHKRGSA